MKKKVKIIIGVSALVVTLLIGCWYLLKPVEVEKEQIVKSDLIQSFDATGHVIPQKSTYVCASLPGQVSDICVQIGETVQTGEEVVILDDSEARRDLEEQLESLELQKTSLEKQGKAARAELSVTRQQLQDQLTSLKLEYEQLYGENGDAAALYRVAQENFSSINVSYWRAYDKYQHSQDPTERAQLSSLEAARASAEQALLQAENQQSESTKAVYESRIASLESQLSQLSGSSSSMSESTKASVGQLDIQKEQLEEKLEKEAPDAPFSGVIWEILVHDGEYVAATQPLYRIYEPDQMEVEVNLLDTQAALLKEGDHAVVKLIDGTTLDAELTYLSAVSTEELSVLGIRENRCRALLRADGISSGIGAGHQTTVSFSTVLRSEVIHIPVSALISEGDGYGVYIIEKGKAVFYPVETGAQSGGRIEITSGITEGMDVIINPYDAGIDGGERVR